MSTEKEELHYPPDGSRMRPQLAIEILKNAIGTQPGDRILASEIEAIASILWHFDSNLKKLKSLCSCVVCGSNLCPPDEPSHCVDCIVEEKHMEDWFRIRGCWTNV
jgi:hypothetical protein